MKRTFSALFASAMLLAVAPTHASELSDAIAEDYQTYLAPLWSHFHRNPELSLMEHKTAKRLSQEMRAVGFEVTEGVGGTGIVAMMRNGPGPTVMMRADMDGLPVKEQSGLANASTVMVEDWDGNTVGVMHACGHDVHITSLVGTARRMAATRDQWSGTLMLIGQPAEEKGPGAQAMMDDDLWNRFGTPDYAFAFHVDADSEAGKITVGEGSPYAGAREPRCGETGAGRPRRRLSHAFERPPDHGWRVGHPRAR